ncbi:MarR family winged helix-turn-helix transcriptional regulator [Amphiplicatus metriothermophilus]|uniref:Transcriptional regulator, MarR family n=1 Tax=Amphiplicatus metriothermophilus TaxID=1519374 RepID=A0A239PJ26_9PROT|nr:MarR family winged helix-turn-helix transcriptional regulator [Amphiplicatus metriothermophilus]MBB5518029.1 DNA-binding MarR family transcriptional regulator [Amphiplicatus metriothermophilus]SNT67637.1 transcriptional regulator, MarR family [Amphiplicatus metriothermophilus]
MESVDLAAPSACLCFNLRKAARAATRALDAALKPVGLTATQFSALAVLRAMDEASVSRLAEAMGADRTTLTRNLAVMERDGLIAYRPSRDRRERRVALTARGRRAHERSLPLWAAFQARAVGRLGEKEAARLLAVLGAVG